MAKELSTDLDDNDLYSDVSDVESEVDDAYISDSDIKKTETLELNDDSDYSDDDFSDYDNLDYDEHSSDVIPEDKLDTLAKELSINSVNEDEKSDTKIYKIVPPDQRLSSHNMSLYEATRIVMEYAAMLDNGATPYIDISNHTSTESIVYESYVKGCIPYVILRHMEYGIEIWKFDELNRPDISHMLM